LALVCLLSSAAGFTAGSSKLPSVPFFCLHPTWTEVAKLRQIIKYGRIKDQHKLPSSKYQDRIWAEEPERFRPTLPSAYTK
ncbi:MAG: hypothetical protein MN733_12485, partial [Nitrososphaera sp.]|nr:hypothetical protein [Nitrososphaera sp.]